jgi:predicted DNA-binding transcriptional regulator AlpA
MNMLRMALPHDAALAGFVRELKAIYHLTDDQASDLQDTLTAVVNTAAVNALASRPAVSQPKELVAQGVQEGPEFMRPDEVSLALGIHLSTLASWRQRGDGPAFRKVGKAVMYRRDDVRAWVALQGAKPVNPPADLLSTAGLLNGSSDPSEIRQ